VSVATVENTGNETGNGGARRFRVRPLTFRARLSLLVMAAVGIAVAVASLVSYISVSHAITNRVDQQLTQKSEILSAVGLNSGTALMSRQAIVILSASGAQETILNFDGTAFTPPSTTLNVAGQQTAIRLAAPYGAPELAVATGRSQSSLRTINSGGTDYRVLALPGAPGQAMIVGLSMESTEETQRTLGIVSSLVGLIGIAVAGAAGFAIGRAALRPVERLTAATEYIATTGDLRHIEVNGKDELARLSTSFNTMLGALARSQEHQKRLVADAGHELRTPLTSIRTNLDLLAQATAQEAAEPDSPRLSAQDRAEMMADVRAQMEEMSVLISDLVELSRDEQPAQAVEPLDFSETVQHAVERVQRRAPGLRYAIDLEPWHLSGDSTALERAVTNLLDNAAKWSPPGGTVTVRLHGGALQVADQGPGIAEEDLAHVFERFYRSPEARTMPGSGLGLAIVRQVAENHGGRVAAARAPGGGALLGLWLPGTGRDGPGGEDLPERAGPAATSAMSTDA
jgi:two-component system, OmpR family, sensor histidine kinase MprB